MRNLGIGITPTSFSNLGLQVKGLFESLFNQSLITSWTYSYTAGVYYRDQGVPGSLIFGGYDQSRFEWPGFNFTLNTESGLTVGVQSMTTSGSLRGAVVFSLASSGYYALIDSTVTQLWLPEDVCSSFESQFGLTYEPGKDFYLVNDTTHANLLRLNPTITFTLGGSTSVGSGGSVSIALPYAAFDLKLGYPYENETSYFPIRRGANRTQYVLGRTLLQEAYLVVDYERRNFSLAPAILSNRMPRPTVVEINSLSVQSNSSTLSKGAMVAIIIVGVSLVLALVISLFCIKKRRARRNDQRTETPVEQPEAPNECSPFQELDSETHFEMLQGRIEVMARTLPHELASDSRHGEGRRATSQGEVYELPGAQFGNFDQPGN